MLGFLGVRLIKCDQSAIRLTLWVLFAEIACEVFNVIVFWQLLVKLGEDLSHITVDSLESRCFSLIRNSSLHIR